MHDMSTRFDPHSPASGHDEAHHLDGSRGQQGRGPSRAPGQASSMKEYLDDVSEKQRLFDQAHTLSIAQQLCRADSMVYGPRSYVTETAAKHAKMQELLKAAEHLKDIVGDAWLPVFAASESVQLAVYGDLAATVMLSAARLPTAERLDQIDETTMEGILPEAILFMAREGLLAEEMAQVLVQLCPKEEQERFASTSPYNDALQADDAAYHPHATPMPAMPPSMDKRATHPYQRPGRDSYAMPVYDERKLPPHMQHDSVRPPSLGYMTATAKDAAMARLLALQAAHFRPPHMAPPAFDLIPPPPPHVANLLYQGVGKDGKQKQLPVDLSHMSPSRDRMPAYSTAQVVQALNSMQTMQGGGAGSVSLPWAPAVSARGKSDSTQQSNDASAPFEEKSASWPWNNLNDALANLTIKSSGAESFPFVPKSQPMPKSGLSTATGRGPRAPGSASTGAFEQAFQRHTWGSDSLAETHTARKSSSSQDHPDANWYKNTAAPTSEP